METSAYGFRKKIFVCFFWFWSSDEMLMFISKNSIYFLYISIILFENGKHCGIECASWHVVLSSRKPLPLTGRGASWDDHRWEPPGFRNSITGIGSNNLTKLVFPFLWQHYSHDLQLPSNNNSHLISVKVLSVYLKYSCRIIPIRMLTCGALNVLHIFLNNNLWLVIILYNKIKHILRDLRVHSC